MLQHNTLWKTAAVALDFGEFSRAAGALARSWHPTRTRFVAAVAALALVAGCNNGSGNNAAPRVAPPAPAAAPALANGGDEPSQAANRSPRKPKRKVPQPSPALDPAVNPLDVFAIVPGEPKWQVVEADGKPVSADAVTAIVPPKGIDSTHFEPPESAAPRARGAAPRHAAPATNPEPSSPAHRTTDRKTAEHKAGGRKSSDRKAGGPDRRAGDQRTGDRKTAGRRLAERKTDDGPAAEPASSEDGKTLPPGFTALSGAKESPLGWPLRIRSDRDGAEMALVAGGAVVVGHDGDPPESRPQLSVVLDSFYMDVAEVTVGRYARFRKALKEEKGRNIVGDAKNASSPANFPVLGVTLTQAEFYAHWAGKQIPTETEWERAARGETAFEHPWGNGRAIWKHARSYDEIDPVKSFRTDVSPFGIYDLAGNAREWCVDHYSPTAFADALKGTSGQLRNWKGPRTGQPENAHVVKGNGPNWNAWFRVGRDGSRSHSDVGFRCVLRLPERETASK